MSGEKLLSIKAANMELIYWSVCPSSRRGGDVVNVSLFQLFVDIKNIIKLEPAL